MDALEYYDFPWGRRPVATCEHAASRGGDGYGDRCCGTEDVPVLHEAHADCRRHCCESCHDERCCTSCDQRDATSEDGEWCDECQREAAIEAAEARQEELHDLHIDGLVDRRLGK